MVYKTERLFVHLEEYSQISIISHTKSQMFLSGLAVVFAQSI